MSLIQSLLIGCGFFALAGLAWSDLRNSILPDNINAVLAVSGAAFHAVGGWKYMPPSELLYGIVFGCGLLLGLRWAFARWRGVEAIGLGDVKFIAGAGCWVGFSGIHLVLVVASFGTLAAAFALSRLRPEQFPVSRTTRIPFGPGLCLALVIVAGSMVAGS